MKKSLEQLVKERKAKVRKGYYRKKQYISFLKKRLKENLILLESQHGTSFGGNIAAIARELSQNPAYQNFTVLLSFEAKGSKAQRAFLDAHGMEKIQLVTVYGEEYYKALATAKYLINDNTFSLHYIKREGQIYLNTWHGTPLKTLGRKIREESAMIGNAQRNFFMADYLLCPNELTKNALVEDYMLSNLGTTRLLLTGYPRNEAFFDSDGRERIRKECGFSGKEIYAYLPTWRGVVANVEEEKQKEMLLRYLEVLERGLSEHQRIYVKLHPITSKGINLLKFKKILPFPSEYETYEFLNATDGLITDYSSIMFDYALTKRRILLFTYDKEEYTTGRGFYFDMDELPFVQADTPEELLTALRTSETGLREEFLTRFCPYDEKNVTKRLCEKVILGKAVPEILVEELPCNGKKNILLYAGNFEVNRTTDRFLELISGLDTERYNYYVFYSMDKVRYRQDRIQSLPEAVRYLGFYSARSISLQDTVRYEFWLEHPRCPDWVADGPGKRLKKREAERLFCGMKVDAAIDFTGEYDDMTQLLSTFLLLCVELEGEKPPKKELHGRRLAKKLIKRYPRKTVTSAGELERLLQSELSLHRSPSDSRNSL